MPFDSATPTQRNTTQAIMAALSAPFDPSEVKFKPQSVKGQRALALAYVDARVIEDRLDQVLGVAGWQDEYETLPDGSVICRLRLKIDGEWITKMDVGSPSEQPDGGDRLKAAFSDALKRAAVKFGVGRYLYRLPTVWCDYDPVKRQFTRLPALPVSPLPTSVLPSLHSPHSDYLRRSPVPPSLPPSDQRQSPESRSDREASTLSRTNRDRAFQDRSVSEESVPDPSIPDPSIPHQSPPSLSTHELATNTSPTERVGGPSANHSRKWTLPSDGVELERRLREYEAKLAARHQCPAGSLLAFIARAGMEAGFGPDITTWPADAMPLAVSKVKEFERQTQRSAPSHEPKTVA